VALVFATVPAWQDPDVLAALNIGAVALGVAAGGLVASLLALGLGVLLSIIGVPDGADIALVVGVLSGLGVGGWLAGWRARHSERFHGSVTGLVLAFLIIAIARIGGSPASTPTVIWLAVLSIVLAGAAGWLAGRRKRPRN
jgi:putative membrane protein (TIGR04086 family)